MVQCSSWKKVTQQQRGSDNIHTKWLNGSNKTSYRSSHLQIKQFFILHSTKTIIIYGTVIKIHMVFYLAIHLIFFSARLTLNNWPVDSFLSFVLSFSPSHLPLCLLTYILSLLSRVSPAHSAERGEVNWAAINQLSRAVRFNICSWRR